MAFLTLEALSKFNLATIVNFQMNQTDDLPQRSLRHATGERGIAILKLALPTQWILRNQTESDYGIDVEIELAGKTVTGKILKAQVRTKTPIAWSTNNTFREPFGSGKFLYWRSISLPVVLFLVDNSSGVVYWQKASGAIPADARLPDEIIVEKKNELKSTLDELINFVTTFRNHVDARKILYRLPFFLNIFEKRRLNVDLDCFLSLEYPDFEELNYVYDETAALMFALGLPGQSLIPWQIWLIRSTSIFGDSGELHNGIHDEILDYLFPMVEKIKVKAKEIIDPENINYLNFSLKARLEDSQISYSAPLVGTFSREFWEAFETDLEARNAKRYSAVKRQTSI
ncbi:MAG: hypothetical protein JWM68_2070 [Verrucomicrobiales bacterium]|nr:hypothetical protein [Verrucomicrobiales bacterium]